MRAPRVVGIRSSRASGAYGPDRGGGGGRNRVSSRNPLAGGGYPGGAPRRGGERPQRGVLSLAEEAAVVEDVERDHRVRRRSLSLSLSLRVRVSLIHSFSLCQAALHLLRYRATALAKIAAFWRDGDVAAATAHARAVDDVAIWADWFAAIGPAAFTPSASTGTSASAAMHTASLLLPHVTPTLESRFEDHALAGIHLATLVVNALGNVLRSAVGLPAARRGGGGGGGSDVAATPAQMRAAFTCVEELARLLPPLGALAARDGAAARQARALEAKIRALEDV